MSHLRRLATALARDCDNRERLIQVLKLDEIIAVKEKLGREKDVAVLPVLRQTALEIQRRNQG